MNSPSQTRALPQEAEEALEAELRGFFHGRDLGFYRMMQFQLGHVNERGEAQTTSHQRRLHGTLFLATTQALFGDYSPAIKYAVSLELMENFLAIHGDVQDSNTEHSGKASVWWKWGPAQAINAGDGMHALARLAILDLCDEGEPLERVGLALEIVDEATLRRCEGEFQDADLQERVSIGTAEYLQMTKRRAGALFGAAAEMALIFDDEVEPERREALKRCGQYTGVIKQLIEDYTAFFSETERSPVQQGRIIAKKKNLPIAHFFETVEDPSMLRTVGEMFIQRVVDPSRIDELVQMVDDAGGREFTVKTIRWYLAEVRTALHDAGVVDTDGDGLMELVTEITGLHSVPPVLDTDA